MFSPGRNQLYLLHLQYSPSFDAQGVAVARMARADRDDPAGKVDVWKLSNPSRWTRPVKVMEGGETARLFVSGVSEYPMTFEK